MSQQADGDRTTPVPEWRNEIAKELRSLDSCSVSMLMVIKLLCDRIEKLEEGK